MKIEFKDFCVCEGDKVDFVDFRRELTRDFD